VFIETTSVPSYRGSRIKQSILISCSNNERPSLLFGSVCTLTRTVGMTSSEFQLGSDVAVSRWRRKE